MTDEIPPTFSEFAVGSQIAGYRLEEQIGRGGMAVVYRAYDARLDRNVALKILSPGLAFDDAFRHRFIRESRAAAAVDHPNIIPVFDAGEASGVLFIAMRFVHGRDARTLLDRTGPLPPARASDIIAQVASALDAAHARGLVHRDVKPANMLLDEVTGGDRQDHVYLSDFGLTKHSLSQTGITSQGQVLGTLDYIAPEQIEGRAVDGRTDLYALACAAFELLSGAPPFKRSGGLAVVWAQLSEPPPPLTVRRPDLPSAVDDVLARAMAKSPADRFGRCSEFAAALREALGLGSAESRRSGGRPVPGPATQIAVMRADLPSGPAGDAPWVGEAAPADAARSAGAVSNGAAPAGAVASAGSAVSAAGARSVGDEPWSSAQAEPGAEAPSAGEAAPASDVTSIGAAPSAQDAAPGAEAPSAGEAAPASDVTSIGAAASAQDAASAAGDVAREDDATPPWGTPLPWPTPSAGGAPSAGGTPSPGGVPSAGDAASAGGTGSAGDAPSAGGAGSAAGAPSAGGVPLAGSAASLWDAGQPVEAASFRDSTQIADASAARDLSAAESGASAGSHEARLYSGRSYEAGLFVGRPREAGPPTEAVGSAPAVRSTTPGLTEPGALQFEPRLYGAGGRPPRGPWWRSRAALAAAAAVVVLGIVGAALALVHGGGGKPASGLAASISAPAATRATASAPLLSVRKQTVTLGGNPFGVVVTPDGQYSFVSLGDSVAVLKNGGPQGPTKVATIPAPGAKKSLAITPNGQYLLAAEGSGAYVINVKDAEAGDGSGAVKGTLTAGPAALQSVEVSISSDSRFAFITLQDSGAMAVFNLQKVITSGFVQSGFVGDVALGSSPVGIAQSPDGKWLYVTSEIPAGRLYVINMHRAETNPMAAQPTWAAVGAGPARVIVSPDGRVIWVTDRDSNALVALSADKLLTTPSRSIIARVNVGENPIGLAFVKDGADIVVADADTILKPGKNNLAVISTQAALHGQGQRALLGFIPAGATPRELAVAPDGKSLLSTDNSSGQLQVIDVGSLH